MTTPFDGPHAELAWMFLQSMCEGGDLDEGFTLLSDDFTFWSLITRISFDKQTFRRSIDTRKKYFEVTIDLLRCVNDGDTVVVEAEVHGKTVDGIQYDSPFACFCETRDGLIVSIREYSDTRSAAAVLPPPGSAGYLSC